jgi:hypothetical protein
LHAGCHPSSDENSENAGPGTREVIGDSYGCAFTATWELQRLVQSGIQSHTRASDLAFAEFLPTTARKAP